MSESGVHIKNTFPNPLVNWPKPLAQLGNKQSNANQTIDTDGHSYTQTSIIDFTNMSPNEFGSLVKAGRFKGDLPPIVLPPGGLDVTKEIAPQLEQIADVKIDYIDFVQKRIAYNESNSNWKAADSYKALLAEMQSLHGKSNSTAGGINVFA